MRDGRFGKLVPCVDIGFSKKAQEVGTTTKGCRNDLLQRASEAVARLKPVRCWVSRIDLVLSNFCM